MNAPDPRENPDLLGQEPAEAVLAGAQRSGRLHHAWLLTGPEGVGKATLAFRFARRLFAGLGAADSLFLPVADPVFRRVASGGHADLLVIARGWDEKRKRLRAEIVVDQVREAQRFLHLTPGEGGWRVLILDGADRLNANAANALLKLLEEPPARAIVLLTCAAPGRLPATVRSRCRVLRLAPLAEAPLATLLARFLPDLGAEERERLAALAEGSPGRALRLAEAEGPALARLVDEALDALPAGLPTARLAAVLEKAGASEESFAFFLGQLRAALAAAVRAAARGRADPDQSRLLASRPLAAWGEVWQGLREIEEETLGLALDRRSALLEGLSLLSPSP